MSADKSSGSKDKNKDRWQKLEVWKLSDDLAYKLYPVTKKFPKEEMYGLTSQLRRAALSVPTNIVEGYSKKGDKELSRFINFSLGSMAETKYLLYFSHRIGYMNDKDYQELKDGYNLLGKMLWKFYEKIQ